MAQLFTNNGFSTLAAYVAAGDLTITVATGEGVKFPSPTGGDYAVLTLTQASTETNWEVVHLTARTGDVLTVTRAQESTTALAWNAGDKVVCRITAGFLNTAGNAETQANKDASGGYAGLTLLKLNLKNALGTITNFFTSATTAARTWTMPDKDGTVAMTSDITIPSHSALSNLSADDHTQYALADGTRGSFAATSHNHDASAITSGTINIARLPAAALERLVAVANQAARYALTTATVQLGDTVKDNDTGLLWMVVDEAHLGDSAGYQSYTASGASTVPWGGITGTLASQSDLVTALGLKQDAAGKDSSGGYAGLTLLKLNLKNALGTFTNFFTSASTAARTWTMPDKDGTVAMLSDVGVTPTLSSIPVSTVGSPTVITTALDWFDHSWSAGRATG